MTSEEKKLLKEIAKIEKQKLLLEEKIKEAKQKIQLLKKQVRSTSKKISNTIPKILKAEGITLELIKPIKSMKKINVSNLTGEEKKAITRTRKAVYREMERLHREDLGLSRKQMQIFKKESPAISAAAWEKFLNTRRQINGYTVTPQQQLEAYSFRHFEVKKAKIKDYNVLGQAKKGYEQFSITEREKILSQQLEKALTGTGYDVNLNFLKNSGLITNSEIRELVKKFWIEYAINKNSAAMQLNVWISDLKRKNEQFKNEQFIHA